VIRNSDGSSSTVNNLGGGTILRGNGPARPCNQFGMTVTCD